MGTPDLLFSPLNRQRVSFDCNWDCVLMSTFTEVYPVEAVELDLCDVGGMRHALDDAVWNVLELAYPADNKVSNLKIAIGLACCAIGALAYYPPIPHPDNIPLVSFLIGLFVVLYGGLNAYVMFINGDWLFVSTPLSKRNNAVLKVLPTWTLSRVITLQTSTWEPQTPPSP